MARVRSRERYGPSGSDRRAERVGSSERLLPERGIKDPCDCASTDPSVFAAPAEIRNLHWTAPGLLAWDSDAANSGAGTHYDVMTGDLTDVDQFGTGAGELCLADDQAATQTTEGLSAPAPAAGRFYLVRGHNTCGRGRYETATDGRDRITTGCP